MSCIGCKYEDYPGWEWPCFDCSRVERDDMYEPTDDDEEEEE